MQNPFNIKGDQSHCGFDFRKIFNSTMVVSSNFALTGWKAQAINNWLMAPLIHIQDGAPFTVTSGVDNSLTEMATTARTWSIRLASIPISRLLSQKGGNRSWVTPHICGNTPLALSVTRDDLLIADPATSNWIAK